MPIYHWKCKKCQAELDILRSFSEYADEPKADDPDYPQKVKKKKECEHEWQKEMGKFLLARGNNWKGSKGNW